MASRIKPQENRSSFKKRPLRPWKPVIELDNSSHSNSIVNSGNAGLFQENLETGDNFENLNNLNKEFSLELFQKPLENALAIKTQEQADIRSKLSSLENSRITVGGFFKPKNILFLDEQESSEQTYFLLNAQRDRKFEISEINHQLKLAEMLEQIQGNTQELSTEHRARTVAEEKTLTAQKAYEHMLEQKQTLETKLSIAEHIKNTLEQKTAQLEANYKETSQHYESQLQALSLETQSLHNLQQNESELRKQREADLNLLQIELETLLAARLAAEEKVISTQQELQQVLEHSQALADRLFTSEQTKVELEHRVSGLEISLQDRVQQYESQLQALAQEAGHWQSQQQAEANLKKEKEEALNLLQIQYQTLLDAQATAEANVQSVQTEFQQSQILSQALAEKLATAEQIKNELEHKASNLEQSLQETNQKYQLELQAFSLETEKWQTLQQTEEGLRKQREVELETVKQSERKLEENLKQTSEKWETAEQALEEEIHLKRFLENQNKKIEAELFQLFSDNQNLNQQLTEEKNAFELKMMPFQDQMKKVNGVLNAERNLRQHLESQNQEMSEQILKLELQIQAEARARQCAEEKAKNTLIKASEAVMNVLSSREIAETSDI